MSRFPSPLRILAEHRHCRVLGLPDGNVQFDFGAVSLVFTQANFLEVCRLLEGAMLSRAGSGLLACAGPRRGVCYCEQHDTLALIFDRAILRFRPLDLPAWPGCAGKGSRR